jgi:hypothetical protein
MEDTCKQESPINPAVAILAIDAVDRADQPVVADLKEALVIKFVRVILWLVLVFLSERLLESSLYLYFLI